MRHLHTLLLSILILVSLTSCSKDEVSSNVTSITVKLKSTTGELNNVFLDIADVEFRVGQDNANTWISLGAINHGAQEICSYNEETTLLLVDQIAIESTFVHEIRLVLGDNNFMNSNGLLVSLDVESLGNDTPSNLIKTELIPNRSYEFVIDVDIDNSISFNAEENMMVLNPQLYTAIRQFEY